MSHRFCGHGVTLDRECAACAALYRIEQRQQEREAKMREALINAKSLLVPRAGDDRTMRVAIEEIEAALAL